MRDFKCMSGYLQPLQRCYRQGINERKAHLKRLNEMLNFAVIIDSCCHVKLTNRLQDPSKKRKHRDGISSDVP